MQGLDQRFGHKVWDNVLYMSQFFRQYYANKCMRSLRYKVSGFSWPEDYGEVALPSVMANVTLCLGLVSLAFPRHCSILNHQAPKQSNTCGVTLASLAFVSPLGLSLAIPYKTVQSSMPIIIQLPGASALTE